MKDPALLAEAKQSHLDISKTSGEALQHLAAAMAPQPEVPARAGVVAAALPEKQFFRQRR